jgi:alkanesulfonate monooxygenase SsuD/methylene tetrahydromethanopterin reductase-like flavin-dependent oxidoreductase (luciferase family)
VASAAPETTALAGAVAAWTRRVRIRCAFTPQLHSTIWLTKSLATLDRISLGRIEASLGVGPRDEDYRALVIDPARQNVQELATVARRMRWLWQGDHLTDTMRPIGPPPYHPPGPPLLIHSQGVASALSGSGWADGIEHTVLGPGETELEELAEVFGTARALWAAEGRPVPRLVASFWFALEETARPDARAQVAEHVREYVDWTPPAFLDDLVTRAGFAGTGSELADLMRRIEDLGADEVTLIPTSADVAQLDVLAAAVGKTVGSPPMPSP